MKKMLLLAIGCIISLGGKAAFADEVVWEDIGNGYLNIRTVLVDSRDSRIIYFGSEEGIFRSSDSGKSWKNVFSLKGGQRQVNVLAYGIKDKSLIFAATGNGLFCSLDGSGTWLRLFQGKSTLENDCSALAVSGDCIYLGTKSGLFVSRDQGKSWKKQPGVLGHSEILSIACDEQGDNVYAACVQGLFRSGLVSDSWKKVFTAFSKENLGDENEELIDSEEKEEISIIRFTAVDPAKPNLVYLALSSGIFFSPDKGKAWERLNNQGLIEQNINSAAVAIDSGLYCASGKGIYLFKDNNWRYLSARLVSGVINGFTWDRQSNLYVAASKGLFRSSGNFLSGEIEIPGNSGSFGYLNDGPPIAEVQSEAMKFAEVEPQKIMNWRKLAAKKAWLPKLNLGLNRETTDLWHWESGSTTKDGDDSLRKGHDSVEWDVTFSWDLGGIVWSDDQNSIDVRSRLSTQLRNDILDEVTKLYFERIRVKRDLENLDILEKNKRMEKELRIRELNAYLDGFTGGYFSRNIAGSAG